MLNKVYIVFFVLFIGLVLGAGWYFNSYRNSSGLDIVISFPEIIPVGVPFSVVVGVSNMGKNVLSEAKVSLSLGDGMIFPGASGSKTSDTKNIGNLGSGGVIGTNFDVVVLGGANASSTKNVVATVSYLPKGVSSRFEKKVDGEFLVTVNGLALNLIMPNKISSGDDFSFIVKYKNISDINLKSLRLVVDYPAGFEFKKATLNPDIGKNIWDLGDLRKGSEMEFKVTGNILGSDDSANKFISRITSDVFGDDYVVAESEVNVGIVSSLLDLKASLNEGDSEVVIGTGENLHYKVSYANKTERGLEDAVLAVQLTGDMFDFSTLKTNGIISPSGSSIVWNKITNRELSAIPIGGSGFVIFDIKTKNSYPIQRLGDKNFTLKLNSRMEAGGVAGAVQIENKVKGAVAVIAKVYFRDAETGILNKGTVPPRVGAPINYTVHWVITNYATDVSDVNLQAVLPDNVKYTGVSKTSANNDIVYNSTTNTVSWHVDKIFATKGLVDKPIELIFQIEVTPRATQVGNVLLLMSATNLTAKDDFTGMDLTANGVEINSASKSDASVGVNEGIVVP